VAGFFVVNGEIMKVLKIIGIGFLALLLLAVIIALIPGGDKKLKETNEQLQEKIEEQKETISGDTPARKLAILDTNNPNPPSQTITAFAVVLKELNSKCTEEDEQEIADYIVFS